MKFLRPIFAVSLIFLTGRLLAAFGSLDFEKTPAPNSYVSEGVYRSSNTAAVTTSTNSVIISSYAFVLHTVTVNTAGSVGSSLRVWDTRISTSHTDSELVANIDTTSKKSYLYDIYMPSGCAINNIGGADVTIVGRQK